MAVDPSVVGLDRMPDVGVDDVGVVVIDDSDESSYRRLRAVESQTGH
jgi:hypothetical protein